MESRFEPAGSLERPGRIGRAVRLVLGAGSAQLVLMHVRDGHAIAATPPADPGWWLAAAVGIWVVSYVVNVGFTLAWGRWPQYATIGLATLLGLGGLLLSGRIWTPALGWFAVVFMTYTFGHLGLSFLLSSLLATPGCEMRAIPHLLTTATGRSAREHRCCGPLDAIDRWEHDRTRRLRRISPAARTEHGDG